MVRGVVARHSRLVLFGLIVLTIGAAGAWAQREMEPPEIVFFGLLYADDTLIEPSDFDGEDRAIFERPFGSSFSLVVEAKRGSSGTRFGSTIYDRGCPSLQVQVTRPLGDGSPEVCDTEPPDDGGVPAIDPPDLSDDPEDCDTFNDLGCRFVDGAGAPEARMCGESCVLYGTGQFDCVSDSTTDQFCGRIAKSAEFPVGDTLVTARVQDLDGVMSEPVQIIIHVLPPPPTPTPARHNDDDACMISPQGGGSSRTLVLLLVPAVLLWLRRRRM